MPKKTSSSTAATFNLLQEPMLSDPYPSFQALRKESPVFHDDATDHWVISRYEDIKQVFQNSEDFSATNTLTPVFSVCPAAQAVFKDSAWGLTPALGNNDKPGHTRFRGNLQKAFLPRHVKDLEPFVIEEVNAAIDKILNSGSAELMEQFIVDLPARVILKLIGLTDEELPLIKQGGKNRILYAWGKLDDEAQVRNSEGLVTLFQRCRELVDERLAEPRDDLTSSVLAVRDGDDSVFTLNEVASVLFAMFTAGHETTASLLGNAIYQLLRDRRHWEMICEDSDLIPNAIEEILRFDSSVFGWRRRAKVDIEVGGISIPVGGQLLLLLGSANHDEAVFEDPEILDIKRKNAIAHLSFGKGIHTCMGNVLARMESKQVLSILSARVPSLRLAEDFEPSYYPNVAFHSMRSLQVVWDT